MKSSLFNLVTIAILIFLVIISIIIIKLPPLVWFDPSAGFQTMFSWINGGDFNYTKYYDFSCLTNPKEMQQFNSIWSPGQYIFPYIFYKLGLNLGLSISIVTIIFTLIGLIGYYNLFFKFNFSKDIAILSCFFILTSRFLLFNFGNYNGGDLLIFGGFPWIVLITYKLYNFNYITFVLTNIVLLIIGVFLKLSFLITHLSILAWIVLISFKNDNFNIKKKSVYTVSLVIISLFIFYSLLYTFYLSKGWNATEDDNLKLTATSKNLK